MLYVTQEAVSSFISSNARAVLLLYVREDDLCHDALTSLNAHTSLLLSEGFECAAIDVTDLVSPLSDEVACVRVPQFRAFVGGKLSVSFVGVPSSYTVFSTGFADE